MQATTQEGSIFQQHKQGAPPHRHTATHCSSSFVLAFCGCVSRMCVRECGCVCEQPTTSAKVFSNSATLALPSLVLGPCSLGVVRAFLRAPTFHPLSVAPSRSAFILDCFRLCLSQPPVAWRGLFGRPSSGSGRFAGGLRGWPGWVGGWALVDV